jgi:Leucine-rich repeat (LRR) protein
LLPRRAKVLDDSDADPTADSFRHIKALTSIDLSANSLTSIDLCLFDLPDLQSINLNVNFIKSVPPTVGDITSLTELRINNNAVVLIPAEIRHLTLLKVLDLSHNSIRALPPMIGMCNEVIGKLAHLEVGLHQPPLPAPPP